MIRDISNLIYCEMMFMYVHHVFDSIRLICAYSVKCWEGQPVYEPGYTAYDCVSGNNPRYDGLCCPVEPYKNEWGQVNEMGEDEAEPLMSL